MGGLDGWIGEAFEMKDERDGIFGGREIMFGCLSVLCEDGGVGMNFFFLFFFLTNALGGVFF